MAELNQPAGAGRRPRDAFRVEHLTDGRIAIVRKPGITYLFDTAAEAERFLAYIDARDADDRRSA